MHKTVEIVHQICSRIQYITVETVDATFQTVDATFKTVGATYVQYKLAKLANNRIQNYITKGLQLYK